MKKDNPVPNLFIVESEEGSPLVLSLIEFSPVEIIAACPTAAQIIRKHHG